MALSDELKTAREKAVRKASGAIDDLAAIAAEIDMDDATVRRFGQTKQRLESDTFNLILLGRFRVGKSTMMNALLGKTTRPIPELVAGQGPMPVGDLPTTATLTSIRYSQHPYVRMLRFDGKTEEWSFSRYLDESIVRDDEDENERVFRPIQEFEVGLPAELCEAGVCMFDSPGVADMPQRTAVTKEAIERCDAAIVVYRSDVLAGEDEREFSALVQARGTRIFTIINMRGMAADKRFRTFAWNRLVKTERGGPTYEGQDFTTQDIYLIDALQAFRGKSTEDDALVEESGMALFERKLGEFLQRERHYIHLQKFIRTADLDAEAIHKKIAQHEAALRQDEQQLQHTYQELLPRIEAVGARREKLPPIFHKYRRDAERELRLSFTEAVNRLRLDLPGEMSRRELPGWRDSLAGQYLNQYQQKKLVRGAKTLCEQIVTERLTAWGQQEVGEVMTTVTERLLEELQDEITRIEREYDDLHFELTGWKPDINAGGSVTSMSERVLAGGLGLLVGDLSSVFGAGGGGLRSVAGAFGGQLAAGIVLSAIGVTTAAVFVPVVMVAGMLAAVVAGKLDKGKVISKALEEWDPALARLPAEAGEKLDALVVERFDELEAAVMEQVSALIEEEEQTFRKLAEENRRSQTEKAREMARYQDAIGRVEMGRKALSDVLVTVRQAA